jgi:hypothetical protein
MKTPEPTKMDADYYPHITPERIDELWKQAFDNTGEGGKTSHRFAALLFAEAAAPKNRKDALRKLLLSEDGLTAQECEWVNELNEGDEVKLRGGQSVAVVKSVYRQKGLAPDYYTLILANGDTLDLSGDEIADIYEPAAPEKGKTIND